MPRHTAGTGPPGTNKQAPNWQPWAAARSTLFANFRLSLTLFILIALTFILLEQERCGTGMQEIETSISLVHFLLVHLIYCRAELRSAREQVRLRQSMYGRPDFTTAFFAAFFRLCAGLAHYAQKASAPVSLANRLGNTERLRKQHARSLACRKCCSNLITDEKETYDSTLRRQRVYDALSTLSLLQLR